MRKYVKDVIFRGLVIDARIAVIAAKANGAKDEYDVDQMDPSFAVKQSDSKPSPQPCA